MSVSKKRKNENGLHQDHDDFQRALTRKQRIKASSPGNKMLQVSPFLEDKKSRWQQAMEQLNERISNVLSNSESNEDGVFASMEYIRMYEWINNRYNPSCGLVVAMGSDDGFQLGVSPSAEAGKACEYPATLVSHLQKIIQVAGGGLHSLALTENGQVLSFGVNDDHALGRGDIDADKIHMVEPIIKGFRDSDRNQIVAIDAGDSHSLLLSINGNVYQCGMYKDVDSGKFRDVPIGSSASPKGTNIYPTLVDLPGSVRDIEAGESFNAAILENGKLFTWGMGHFGQLARSKNMDAKLKKDEETGREIPGVYELGKMWIGEEYETDVVEKDRYGNPKLDENGKPKMVVAYRYFPDLIKAKFLKPAAVCWADPCPKRCVLSVACGELFMLAVARDGGFDTKIYSAGHNGYGQLGHGDSNERHVLTSIKALENKLIKKVAAGTSHALALDMGGNAVFAWGRSDYGQVGHTDSIRHGDIENTPQKVAFPNNLKGTRIKDISAGSSVSIAVTVKNEVYTWGFGESGATGHSGCADINRPKKLDVLKRAYSKKNVPTNCHVLQAAGGAQHSLMVIQRFE